MMEYWNNGKMGSGKMEECVIDRIPNYRKIKKRILPF
jgi:hypothetical protein